MSALKEITLKKLLLLVLATLAALVLPVAARASIANVYIAAAAAGAGDGTSCANARANSFFNTAGNWGAGATQIGSDTTVHWCGTISSGTNAAVVLTFQGSGTSGHPVTLIFESGSSMSASYWNPNNGAITMSSKSFIVIDGNNVGRIFNSRNGKSGVACPGGTCTSSASSNGIVINNSKNITVQNLTIDSIYVNTASGGGGATAGISGACVDTENTSNSGASNILITHNVCHDSETGFYYAYGGTDSGYEVSYNEVYNINWGSAAGPQGTNKTLAGPRIHHNYIHDFANWDDFNQGYTYHHDGIFFYATSAGSNVTGALIYSNHVGGNFGFGTANIYLDNLNGGGLTMTATVFNNVLNPSNMDQGNGGITAQNEGNGPVNVKVYNNTFWGDNTDQGVWLEGGSVVADIRNNIYFHWDILLNMSGGASIPATTDYNLYNSAVSDVVNNGGTGYGTLAAWKTASSKDTNSVNGAPNLNATTYIPGGGSAAIGAGTNLTSLGITELDTDYAGNARPAVGAWDIGAVQSASVPAPSVGFSPTSLSFSNQTVLITSSPLSTTLTNTGTATLNISSITLTGTNSGDFAISANTCGATVAASATCSISVTFTPSVAAARSANISVADDAAGSPQTVPLTGTGVSATPPPTPHKPVLLGALPPGIVSQPYSGGLNATGAQAPTVWTVNPTLPSGLSMNPATGSITGTPIAAVSQVEIFTLTDSYRCGIADPPGCSSTSAPYATPLTITAAPPPPTFQTIRVKPGTAYTDSAGAVWSPDTPYCTKGSVDSTTHAITGALPSAADGPLYQTERWNVSTCVFPAPAGTYTVTLKLAENYFSAAGKRRFNVAINGAVVLTNYDIFAAAGGQYRAIDLTFPAISPGAITVSFTNGTVDDAKYDAISIALAGPPPPTPTLNTSCGWLADSVTWRCDSVTANVPAGQAIRSVVTTGTLTNTVTGAKP